MTLDDAVVALIIEATRKRQPVSNASIQRTAMALKALGLKGGGFLRVMGYLDLVDANGNPYLKTAKRTW